MDFTFNINGVKFDPKDVPYEFESSRHLTPCQMHDAASAEIDGQDVSLVAPYKPFLIGISGKIGSGKDETFRIIKSVVNQVNNVKFAEKLKQMCAVLIGCSREQLEDREFKNTPLPHLNGMTPRMILINVGDGLRGLLYDRVWIDAGMADVRDYTAVTDVRYPNEAEEILSRAGILIRLERDGVEMLDTPTETALDNFGRFSYIIRNNGTIADLESAIWNILSNEGIV